MVEPRVHWANARDRDLDGALIDVGQRLAYPVTPDIAGRVRERLEGEVEQAPRARVVSLPFRRVGLAAAGLLFAILAGLLLVPPARTAIADRFGLSGVVIRWVEDVPTPSPSPAAARLMLGRQLTLEEARAAVDFPIQLPAADLVASPSEVYLLGQGEEAMVSIIYPAGPGLPESEFIGVGALLTQFKGETERALIEKGLAAKVIDPSAIVEHVTVDGERGYWVTGAPHGFFLVCGDDGECRQEHYRLAGNVLLWAHDGLTMRLESALGREEALAVAASVRAIE